MRRVIRALEIHHITGQLPSELQPAATRTGHALVLGLTMPRDALYRRIDQRVDRMMAAGLLEEVEELRVAGFSMEAGPLNSPGYRELGQYLEGEMSLERAVERTKTQTHRLARRQYTWFKSEDPRIRWIDAGEPGMVERAAKAVSHYLGRETTVIE